MATKEDIFNFEIRNDDIRMRFTLPSKANGNASFDAEADGTWTVYSGNEASMDAVSCSFNYGDYTLPSSSQWGYGLQFPLLFLGVECEVNLVIKSQYGFTGEISYVTPFFYHVRYYHSMI